MDKLEHLQRRDTRTKGFACNLQYRETRTPNHDQSPSLIGFHVWHGPVSLTDILSISLDGQWLIKMYGKKFHINFAFGWTSNSYLLSGTWVLSWIDLASLRRNWALVSLLASKPKNWRPTMVGPLRRSQVGSQHDVPVEKIKISRGSKRTKPDWHAEASLPLPTKAVEGHRRSFVSSEWETNENRVQISFRVETSSRSNYGSFS